MNATTSTFTPTTGGTSWANKTASPTVEKPQGNLEDAQLDSATDNENDSALIRIFGREAFEGFAKAVNLFGEHMTWHAFSANQRRAVLPSNKTPIYKTCTD